VYGFAKSEPHDAKAEDNTAVSLDHFSCEPETVTWADVGTLANYLKGLREISDAAFQEGEHAA
jgi:hypothetical protein